MHITKRQLKKQLGPVKANMIPGIKTTITNHATQQKITVVCVELNKRTAGGNKRRVFKIVNAAAA
jgi:hypothetical protein|tara:strand:+ start:515 stop:709 length:195 start_codon:yes stop_codon:yes gene_type:complete